MTDGAILAQVEQHTEGLAQQQELLRIQAARSQSEVQASRLQTEAEVLSTPSMSGSQASCAERGKHMRKSGKHWFATWFSSHFTNGKDTLGFATSQVAEVGNDEITARSTSSGWTDLSRTNAQVQVALVSLCRDEAVGGESAKNTSLPTVNTIFDC